MKKTKNILVITYWSYKDALIQAYTLPYLYLFDNLLPHNRYIYLVTLEQRHLRLNPNERAQVKERLRLQGIKWIDFNYYRFGFGSLYWIPFMIRLILIALTRGISHIHGWCTPAGSIAYVVSLITGKPLVIDSYEPHAEVMLETKTWSKKSFQFRFLYRLEKLQGKRAKMLICCVEGMADYVREKFNFKIRNKLIKPACVDLEKFSFANRKNSYLLRKLQLEDKFVCVYAGKFGGLYLEQEVFDFFKVAYDYWGDKFRVLLLTNEGDSKLKKWISNAGLPEHIIRKVFVFHSLVPDYMGLGDFGISPYNPVPSRRFSAPIKNAEYWALGLPVVITDNIANDSQIIREHRIGAVIEKLDTENYLKAVKEIDTLLQSNSTEEIYNRIRSIVEKERNFGVARKVYETIYAA